MQKPQIAIFAPLDSHCQRVTQGVVLVGGVATLPALFLALSGLLQSDIAWYGAGLSAAVAAGFLLAVVAAWCTMPVTLVLDDHALTVQRRWAKSIVVPYTSIDAVTALTVGDDFHPVGWVFLAGLFGYHGAYQSARYGRCVAYATDRDKCIAIARRDGPLLVVSPLLPFACLSALRERMTAAKES